MKADFHPRQAERLQALRSYEILDTPREADFDDIVELASAICGAPISVVNLIDEGRQWFKAEVGLGVRETPLDTSLCSHAILKSDFMEIEDTLLDPRMADNALCTGENGLRFYAGALLQTEEGLPLGTLCVLDFKPRVLTPFQRRALQVLSRQVMSQLELRRALRRQTLLGKEIDHRVKNSLQTVASLVQFERRKSADEGIRSALDAVSQRIRTISLLHEQLYRATEASEMDLGEYLTRLGELLRVNAHDNVSIVVEAETLLADSRKASAIGMIVSEFVANALKHAFPDGRPGVVRLSLRALGDGAAELACEDDGVGLGPIVADRAPGFGLRIISASVAQIGGRMQQAVGGAGYGIRIVLPLK
jgi:two-component sensor histidine kinase